MDFQIPDQYVAVRDRFPRRPEGTNPIVYFASQPSASPLLPRRYFEVLKVDDVDGMVQLTPLDVTDDRNPFWIGPETAVGLIEVPGAYLDDKGYLRIPTRYADPEEGL